MVHLDNEKSSHWATEYNIQQKMAKQSRSWKSLLRPSVLTACLAIAGRVVVGPLALLLLFTATKYYSSGSVLIKAEDSFFAFTENDVTMAGGCSGCMGPCKIVLLKYDLFNRSAFVSSPVFNAFVALGPTENLYDFSSLSPEALALGESLDANGAVCQSGTNDWAATHNVITGTARQVLDVISTLGLSVAPQMIRELELSVGRTDGCDTRWSMLGLSRLFQFPTRVGDTIFGKLSAVDLSIFPDYTECRPVVTIDDNLIRSKLALATNGEDSPRATSLVISAELPVTELHILKYGDSSKKFFQKHDDSAPQDDLTYFERNCIGGVFKKLFRDCDDIAYVIYKGKRCSTVEALLLTGYLYYGEHVYQASSVMLLLVARLVPRKILRTFNMLLLRWYMDPNHGTLSELRSCTWYHASTENHKLAGAIPVA